MFTRILSIALSAIVIIVAIIILVFAINMIWSVMRK